MNYETIKKEIEEHFIENGLPINHMHDFTALSSISYIELIIKIESIINQEIPDDLLHPNLSIDTFIKRIINNE